MAQHSGNSLLIIGIGNGIKCDDAIGHYAIEGLRKSLLDRISNVTFFDLPAYDPDILTQMEKYNKVVIIDSVESEQHDPGTVLYYQKEDIYRIEHSQWFATHGVTLPQLLKYGHNLSMRIPEDLLVIGIVGHDFVSFSEQLSIALQDRFPEILDQISDRIIQWK